MVDGKAKKDELMIEAKSFFDFYKKEIGESIRKTKNVIFIDFMKLAEFSKLSDEILSNPEEALSLIELAIDESGLFSNVRVRLYNLSKSQEIKIGNIRSRHLNELIVIEGIIRQASDVRPQVVNGKFECPSCGTIMSVLQIEKKFREPSRCSCGRRGGFRLISKEMVDTQRLVIEEAPESLSGGEQPKRLNVFVKEDLVEPKMEEKTTPGSRIKVIGVLKEVPVPLHGGGLSTRFELAIEANNIIPLEETFEELDIGEEEERQILELAQDPKIFDNLARSIAPSIYGYEEIKKSLVLQLFGGLQRFHADGTRTRGDIHILLIGDPGVAKSQVLGFIANISPKGRYVVGKSTSLDYNEPLLIKKDGKLKFIKIGEFVDRYYKYEEQGFISCDEDIEVLSLNLNTLKLEWKPIRAVFRHSNNEKILSFLLETGRKIKVTKCHSIFCIENGEIICKPSSELKEGDYLVIPKYIPVKNHDLPGEIGKFLGYFIAEGNLYNKDGSYKIQFTLNKNETDIASEINYISEKYLKKEARISNHGENSIRVTIYGKQPYLKFCSWLGNITHKKACEKGIPEIIMNSNPNVRQAFFNSYIIGDAGVTKSERLMSELLYLYLQDKIIASSIESKVNRIAILKDGRKINCQGARFDLQSPNFSKKFKNMRLNFPLNCLPENLRIFFKRKLKQDYNRINLHKVDNNMLLERILRVFKEERIKGKRIKELFGENALEYFSDHLDLFKKQKRGREIEISLTREGEEVCKSIIKIKRLIESDVAFVKIKRIEEIDPSSEFVYDVSTSENENFVAGFGGVVCHNSGAGLTATVVRDEYLRGWSLEAGAMVLANKGLVAIDELEKMDPQERSAMHEAMEQQSVTISKANVQAHLRSETSVLAAANPKFGRFDPYQPIAQQIELPPTLLNRFDIIFTLKDIPDREKDEKIASHVLKEHQKEGESMLIPRELFRKYVAYAKQKIKPVLSDESVDEIKKFYIELRNRPVSSEGVLRPIPISARQLQALIRMGEASAKIRLSETVTKEDAKRVIEIMKYYLTQAGYDYETKTFDIDRISGKFTSSQRNKIFTVRDAIIQLEEHLGKMIPIEEIEKELEGKISKEDIEDALNKLSLSGDVFKPRKGYISRA